MNDSIEVGTILVTGLAADAVNSEFYEVVDVDGEECTLHRMGPQVIDQGEQAGMFVTPVQGVHLDSEFSAQLLEGRVHSDRIPDAQVWDGSPVPVTV